MRFKTAGVHREFFQKNGFIEFESLLSAQEASQLASHADLLLQKRLSNQLEFRSATELYRAGRDLWRDDATLRKKELSHTFAQLAADIFKKPILHLAFDQILRTAATPGFPNQIPSSLNAISSIQPLAGALLLHLSGSSPPFDLIPRCHENVMLLSPDLTIPWEFFFQLPHQSYLLIAYAVPESVYVLRKEDPHTHALKRLGYVFGDRLTHDHHPIVFRNI
jgi:hypothetical protein